MNKFIQSLVGIVSVAPLLFLVGLVLSFLAYFKFPLPLFHSAQLANAFVGIGAVMILIGTAVAFAAQKISRVVTNPQYKATCQDLMQGPYKVSRHPGSLALIIMYVGVALVVNSIAMLVFAGIMILLLSFVFVPMEEKAITSLCPEAYAEYKTKVRMWL